MSYYFAWQPYVSVAEKRRWAEREVAKLKKRGQAIAPVRIEGRKIAKSFWGQSWCTNLERYSDFENRLPRGRTYVRNGSVVDLQIAKGEVAAMVAGSDLYSSSPNGPRLERRHRTIRLRDRHWNPASVVSFRRRRPRPYERNAAISWHFERVPIPYALETDWPVEAAGFEHLHSRIEIAKTLSSRRQDSNLCILKSDLLHFGVLAVVRDARNLLRSEARAPAIRDAQVRVLSPRLRVLVIPI